MTALSYGGLMNDNAVEKLQETLDKQKDEELQDRQAENLARYQELRNIEELRPLNNDRLAIIAEYAGRVII